MSSGRRSRERRLRATLPRMAERGWGGAVATATGVAAAAGAAQLGLAYGLDIISWQPTGQVLAEPAWVASLAWAVWIAATSTIAGAIIADRLRGAPAAAADPGPRADWVTRVLWRLVLAVAAALGALLAVALIAVPARAVELADGSAPQAIAAGYTICGLVVGLALGVAALTARAVAANLIATGIWLWLFGVIAVINGVSSGGEWSRVPLAFWDFTPSEPWFRNFLLPDAAPAVAAALVAGALAALPAARRGDRAAGVATSGAAGPLVLAAAYLLAQPNLVGATAEDLSRHLVIPFIALAGLAGSLLVSAIQPPRPTAEPAPAEVAPVSTPPAATVPPPVIPPGSGTTIPGPRTGPGRTGRSRKRAESDDPEKPPGEDEAGPGRGSKGRAKSRSRSTSTS